MQAGETFHAVLHDITGAETGTKRFGDRILDGVGFLREIQRVAEQHRCAQDRRERIRDVLTGDIRCRSAGRLIETEAVLTEGSGWQHAEGAGDLRHLIGEDVTEHILGHDDIELTRIPDELHRG